MGFFNELLDSQTQETHTQIPGVLLGVVKENYNNKFPGMVKVELILGEEGKNVTDWMRVAMPYTGNEFGTYFLPEIGTEVVVGCNMGDPGCPIVLGSMWNEVDKHPIEAVTEKNTVKKIVTKGGHEIIFQEEEGKEALSIHTPGKLNILFDDENQKILLGDENLDNGIEINAKDGSVTVKAKKKMSLTVGEKEFIVMVGDSGKIDVKTNNINIEAQQGLGLKGQNSKLEGNKIDIKAQGTMKAEASGMMQIKGSMTKIN